MIELEIQILIDYFKALQSTQKRLTLCLGFKNYRKAWLKTKGIWQVQ